jgi:hypothetical protein
MSDNLFLKKMTEKLNTNRDKLDKFRYEDLLRTRNLRTIVKDPSIMHLEGIEYKSMTKMPPLKRVEPTYRSRDYTNTNKMYLSNASSPRLKIAAHLKRSYNNSVNPDGSSF